VIGDNHKGETLYRWETSSGYLWVIFGNKDTHPVYKGDVENGKPNGQGIYTYSNGDTNEGEYKDGGMWNGRYYDKDGNIRYKYVNGKLIKQ
jgi:hypothetical protein